MMRFIHRGVVPVLLILICCMNNSNAQTQLEDLFNLARLPYLKNSTLYQISSHDSTGGNEDRMVISQGETVNIARIEGPGCITRIWLTISCQDPFFLRRMLLRIYWDGEQHPSVETPIGDFFGTGFEYTHYTSLLMGMSSGGYYCYIPMPFSDAAVIEVTNQCQSDVDLFYYHINYQTLNRLDADVGRFHAHWRREVPTKPGENYTILEAEGWGHYIGCTLNMQGYRDDLSFLEGDEMIYVDGESTPSICGTGTEDYFTAGWYFTQGVFSAPFHGLIIKDEAQARIAAYRFHIADCIPFQESIRVTIEHGHANTVQADYSSVAYWYQMEPHKPFSNMLPAPMRLPLRIMVPVDALQGEDLVQSAEVKGGTVTVEHMDSYGPDWSGCRQLLFQGTGIGDECVLSIPVDEPGRYLVNGYFTTGPGYGQFRMLCNDEDSGEWNGYHPITGPSGTVPLGNVRLKAGENTFTLRVSGKDEQALGYTIGLDGFVFIPVRDFVREWQVIGPFDNPKSGDIREGLDHLYPPEREIDMDGYYAGKGGMLAQWKEATARDDGYINLNLCFEPNELTVAYGLSYVSSPDDRDVDVYLGSDDGVKLWVNDQLVHRNYLIRPAGADQDTIQIGLKEGLNRILIKVEENVGGWGFYLRIPNPEEELQFHPVPPEG